MSDIGEKKARAKCRLIIFSIIFFLFIFSSFAISGKENVGFEVTIKDFGSPAKLGDFFNFNYSLRTTSVINDYIDINFWIEKNDEIVSSGSDRIYMDVIEKTGNVELFLPFGLKPGIYDLHTEINYEGSVSVSHRTIEIGLENGIAKIGPGVSIQLYVHHHYIPILIILISLILFFIFIRRYRFCTLTIILFFGFWLIFYYLGVRPLERINISFFYLTLLILFLVMGMYCKKVFPGKFRSFIALFKRIYRMLRKFLRT
jgi:hypothetical protein